MHCVDEKVMPPVQSWKHVIEEELGPHRENEGFSLVDLPEQAKAIASKWAFKLGPAVRLVALLGSLSLFQLS